MHGFPDGVESCDIRIFLIDGSELTRHGGEVMVGEWDVYAQGETTQQAHQQEERRRHIQATTTSRQEKNY